MKLKELLDQIYSNPVDKEYLNWDIQSLSSDSRKVEPNSIFVALKGQSFNGELFIDKAISAGAKVIVSTRAIPLSEAKGQVCYLHVDQPSEFLRQLTLKFYGDPSRKMHVIGVTGTNGKTTFTYLMESIVQVHHKSCGVIGTINCRLGDEVKVSQNTTPSLVENQQILADMRRKGADYCVMEVSSHALDQGRVDLIEFSTGVFTNLTSDHLDYHKTRENYFLAKSLLFKNLSSNAHAVINIDDPYGQKLISLTKAKVITYGIDHNAHVKAVDVEIGIAGNKFKLITPNGERVVQTKLVGRYNVYNMLAAVACALGEKFSFDKIVEALEQFETVPGRLEKVDYGQNFSVFIDFAHTQDALENVLRTIRRATNKKIILVFGCGGDRDKRKRPLMGKVASQLADFSIVTSDNPRSEEPGAIVEDIVKGFENKNYAVIVDRKEAIAKALTTAHPGDVVIVAGKGHETYQIFKDQTIKFNERQIIRELLNVNHR